MPKVAHEQRPMALFVVRPHPSELVNHDLRELRRHWQPPAALAHRSVSRYRRLV